MWFGVHISNEASMPVLRLRLLLVLCSVATRLARTQPVPCVAAGAQQWDVYHQECLLKHGSHHRYMAFIDNDEVRTWLPRHLVPAEPC